MIVTILTVLLIVFWILLPLFMDTSATDSTPLNDSLSLEERYTRALLDLESDLLGSRITDAEFRKRREALARYLESQKG